MKEVCSTPASTSNNNQNYYEPFPKIAIYIIIPLLITALGVSIFILAVVHNATYFLTFLSLSAVVAAFVIWNIRSFRRNAALFRFLRSFPSSDLRLARHGQLVKITGRIFKVLLCQCQPVSCSNISLESSYERVAKCVYTSTLLYEYQGVGLKALDAKAPSFLWTLAYLERLSADFYISDRNSGIRGLVKAGGGARVVPLIIESRLVSTKRNRILCPNLTKWLSERNVSADSRLIRLEEGYVKEGDHVTVIGMLHRGDDDDDIPTIVQPPELISTGCFWQRLLLPVDFDGLIIGLPVPDCSEVSYFRLPQHP